MKNLKRALSFALASVMVIGMMVVGAGAAFTDADEIVNDDAVNTLVALNVIAGKGDGSYFDPAATLTRAEAAKLIVYILHGGKEPVIGTKATPTFTDIKGSWAEAYIEYCTSTGIIAGKGDGTFGPTDTLTGSALAKMLLVAIGYDATVFSLTGNNWEINTNIEANKIDLYEGLETLDPALPISRDNAAQLVYNAIFAGTMVKDYNYNITTGNLTNGYTFYEGRDLYDTKFGGEESEGVLQDVTYDSKKALYTYTIGTGNDTETFKSAIDYTDLFKMNVKVLWKPATANAEKKTYGLYAEDSKVLATGLVDDIAFEETGKIKVNGTVYSCDDNAVADLGDITAYEYLYTASTTVDAAQASAEMKVIDLDGDDKVDYIVYKPFTVGEVTIVSKTSFKVESGSSIDKEDVVVYDGIAKNDFVKITNKNNTTGTKNVYEKIDTVIDGKVTNTKNSGADVKIGGEWYTLALNQNETQPTLGNTYKKMAVVNGYIFTAEVKNTTVAVNEYAVLLKAEAEAGALADDPQGILLLTDGTKITVALAADYTSTGTDLIDALVKFSVEDDVYTLEAADADAFDGTASNTYDDNKIDGMTIADDAIVFIKGTSSTKVITGAELKKTDSIGVTNAYYNEDKTTGFGTIALAYVSGSVSSTSDNLYGYITAAIEEGLDKDDKTVYDVTMWTGAKTETVTTKKDVSVAGLEKGDLVVYKTNADGLVTSIKKITANDAIDTGIKAAINYVTAFDGTNVKFQSSNVYKITEDTVIMYINSDKVEGVAEGVISIADKDVNDAYIYNVYAAANADKELILLVVDDANEMANFNA